MCTMKKTRRRGPVNMRGTPSEVMNVEVTTQLLLIVTSLEITLHLPGADTGFVKGGGALYISPLPEAVHRCV